jgi:signal peptidase I
MNPRSKTPVSEKEQAAKRRKRKRAVGRILFHCTNVFLAVAAVSLLTVSVLFPVLLVSGDSMEPGLNDGDLILLTRTHDLRSGDLVSFKWSDKTLLKRVIACSGDWVMIDESGRVYVNGKLLDEPYVSEFRLGESDVSYPLQVPDGSYFVMGDERTSSLDSRSSHVGCVEYDRIIGKGAVRIWPWH